MNHKSISTTIFQIGQCRIRNAMTCTHTYILTYNLCIIEIEPQKLKMHSDFDLSNETRAYI